jgi:hypothetical protein
MASISGSISPSNINFKWSAISEGCTDFKIDSSRLSQSFFPLGKTTLILEGKDAKNCLDRDTLVIDITTKYFIEAPNIIKASASNATNSLFSLKGGQNFNRIVDLSIYDRWGNKVYFAKDPDVNTPGSGWNGLLGNKTSPGVYVWMANIEFLDCNVVTMKGDVMVLE